MCSKCNGTHVIHAISSFAVCFYPCSDCGPVTEEIQNARLDKLLATIETREVALIKGA